MDNIAEVVRKIKVDNEFLTLNIFNNNSSELSPETIFVTPYSAKTGEYRVQISYGTFFPTAFIDRKNDYGDKVLSSFSTLKDFASDSIEDVQDQVKGYLSLLRITNNITTFREIDFNQFNPMPKGDYLLIFETIFPLIEEERKISVVSVENEFLLPLSQVENPTIDAYATAFMDDNYEKFATERQNAIAYVKKKAFNNFSLNGILRQILNRTQIVVYGIQASLQNEQLGSDNKLNYQSSSLINAS